MASADAFTIQRSDLNGFLFADVGVEANGMTLSVLSALARLGMDPWDEAGRLARQPRAAAIEGLARLIAALPAQPVAAAGFDGDRCPAGGAAAGARAGRSVSAHRARRRQHPRKRLLDRLPWRRAAPPKPARAAPSWTLVLMLAGLLAGLALYWLNERLAGVPEAPAQVQPAAHHRPAYPAKPPAMPAAFNKAA